jgi:hypothetical protein
VITRPPGPHRESIVFELVVGVGFPIVLDDVGLWLLTPRWDTQKRLQVHGCQSSFSPRSIPRYRIQREQGVIWF